MDHRIQILRRQASEDPSTQWALYRAMRQAGLLQEHELPEHIPRINQTHVDSVVAYLGEELAENAIIEMLDFPGECWDDMQDQMYESPQMQVISNNGNTYLTAMACAENRGGELVTCYETNVWEQFSPPEPHNNISNALHYTWGDALDAIATYIINDLAPIMAVANGIDEFSARALLREHMPHIQEMVDSFYDDDDYPDPPLESPEYDEFMTQQAQAQYEAQEQLAQQQAIEDNECRICSEEIELPTSDLCTDCILQWGNYEEYQQSVYEGD